jgi:hypothetical protein
MLVATIGLHSSASTWVFNVARELLAAAHGDFLSAYADAIKELPAEPPPVLLIKSHHGSAALDDWLREHHAHLILSIRDPRDAAVSMAKRFNATLDITIRWLVQDCDRLHRLADQGHPILRYEDRFFENAATVDALAKRLGLAVAPSVAADIFRRYQTAEVRAFAQAVPNLPPKRVAIVGASAMDRVTQIHAGHIGDTSSGKWKTLADARQAELTNVFWPFLQRFGYGTP